MMWFFPFTKWSPHMFQCCITIFWLNSFWPKNKRPSENKRRQRIGANIEKRWTFSHSSISHSSNRKSKRKSILSFKIFKIDDQWANLKNSKNEFLILATRYCRVSLLEKGFGDVNQQDKDVDTFIHACINSHHKIKHWTNSDRRFFLFILILFLN